MMKSFKLWLQQRESSATTRARDAAAKGLYPPSGHLASHTRSTSLDAEKIADCDKKKKKKSKKKD